jgi:hypothetical protein
LQGQRYFTFELTGVYKYSSKGFISISYWNDRGQDKGTVMGHFFSLVVERSELSIGEHVLFSANVNLFYIDYDGQNDGLFISPKVTSSVRNVPFALFFQAIQALQSNISPFPKFRWNLGLSYTL